MLLLEDDGVLLLEDGAVLLLEDDGDSPPDLAGIPGGVFRRALPTWARIARRALPTWQRVWRYRPMPALPTEGEAIIAAVSDDRDYAFDARPAPELRGTTIVSGTILGGTGLDFGAVAVLTEEFDGIPEGKGCVVRIKGGAAGTVYGFACRFALSNGRTFTVPARMSKVADYRP